MWPVALIALLLAAPKPAAQPHVLEGLVRDPNAKPVENALVFARSDRSEDPTLSVRTDARGAFRLTFKRSGPVAVWAQASGLALRKVDRVPLDRPLLLSLARGQVLEGRVTDGTSGSPVPGARVWANLDVAGSPSVLSEPDAGRAVATCDAKGRFRLGGLGPGLQNVSASAHGYGRAYRESVRLDQRPELFLFPGASISGVVAGVDGKPAPGAIVTAARFGFGTRTERADGQGRFEILGIEPGDYDVVATLAGTAPGILRGITVHGVDEERVTLNLAPPVRLTGRILSDPQHPAPGRVFVQDIDGGTTPSPLRDAFTTEAAADGRFHIEGVPPGSLVLGVVPTAFATKRVDVDVPMNRASLDIGDVLVERGLAIRGRVHGPAGPIADAFLSAWASNRSRSRATSDDDGAFVLPSLDPGTYSVNVGAKGFAPRSLKLDAGTADVDIALDVAGGLSGEVTDRSGRPIESFSVTARSVDDLLEAQGAAPSMEFATNDGRFTLENVPAGRWVVLVESFGHASASVPAVNVKSGATTAVGRIRLGSGGSLRGTVVTSTDEPVPGATVAVSGEQGFSFQGGTGPPRTQTDGNGAFEISGLPPGKVDVSATHPAYSRALAGAVEIAPETGPAEVKLVLGQGGRIEGSVRRRDGAPVAGARLRLFSMVTTGRVSPSDFYDNPTASTDADGRFTIERIPAGRARVLLSPGPTAQFAGRQDVDIRDGETSAVDFVLRQIDVSGTVTRNTGPASGLRVMMRPAGGGSYMSYRTPDYVAAPAEGPQRGGGVTDEQGHYELFVDQVGPGQTWVETLDGSTRFATRSVDFPDVDAFTLDFNLGGVPVTGITLDKETEKPVAHVGVWATRREGEKQITAGGGRSDTAGRFQIEVDPGDYTLSGWLEGYANAEIPLAVGPAGSADVRLEMSKGGAISGRVVTAAGVGVPNMDVVATPGSGEGEGETESRPDGSFRLDNLSGNSYSLSAGSPLTGYAILTNVAPGGAPVTLTLQAAGRARLLIRGADRAPIAGAFVTLARLDGAALGRYLGASSDAAGIIDIAVPYGLAELRVGTRDRSATVTLEIKEGEVATAEVTLTSSKAPD